MQIRNPHNVVVFTDLDGCLLNSDYTYEESQPALSRLRELGIPLVLVSSKTPDEMLPLADELETTAPIVCENGGVIDWRNDSRQNGERQTLLGTPREVILKFLRELHRRFRFRSFTDLGIAGIREATRLSQSQAVRAANRLTTEPLLWDDEPDRIDEFRREIESRELTLTRGGRFWHVAGRVNKGVGMQAVREELQKNFVERLRTIAIGDSPIDLPMLEDADLAIVIPGEDGTQRIRPTNPNTVVARQNSSSGWNEEVLSYVNQLEYSRDDS